MLIYQRVHMKKFCASTIKISNLPMTYWFISTRFSADKHIWLVVSTPRKDSSQLGLRFPIYEANKKFQIPNHQPYIASLLSHPINSWIVWTLVKSLSSLSQDSIWTLSIPWIHINFPLTFQILQLTLYHPYSYCYPWFHIISIYYHIIHIISYHII